MVERQGHLQFLVVAKSDIWGIMKVGKTAKDPFQSLPSFMGVKLVSTGVLKRDKRAAVCSVCVKKGTLNTNAKNNNRSFALAA